MRDQIAFTALDGENLHLLNAVVEGVFDNPIDMSQARLFAEHAMHHMLLAQHRGNVVGMISAVTYLHPDKSIQMWINELGVGIAYRRRGIARELVRRMVEIGRERNCASIWLATEAGNEPARRLYESLAIRPEAAVVYFFDAQCHAPEAP